MKVGLSALWVEVMLPIHVISHPEIEDQIGMAKDFSKIIAYAGNIPPRQWVEVRTIFLRPYLQQLDLRKVNLKSGPGKENIWQEKKLADERG